ncbi:MAG: hypothetical protein LW832_05310 [Parachlamydia sp.]|jgi:hypothetical protein|nr:hypothetical protein [Parachlamydia sp.]
MITKIKFLDDSGIKGNRIDNPLFQCKFPATKIKVDRKKTCLEPKKVKSKIVLIDSDHLRKNAEKGTFCDIFA